MYTSPYIKRDDAPELTIEEQFEKLPAETIKQLFNRAIASEEEKQAYDQFQANQKTFRHMYPAYTDNDHNAKLMQHNWRLAFGVEYPTLEQMEESFFALRASGVLTINQKAAAKEDAAAQAVRADEIIATRKASEFNEEAAYEMDLDELRLRANGVF
jgi:hypothetical protein